MGTPISCRIFETTSTGHLQGDRFPVGEETREQSFFLCFGSIASPARLSSACARSPVKLPVAVVSKILQELSAGAKKIENSAACRCLIDQYCRQRDGLRRLVFVRGHPKNSLLTWSQRAHSGDRSPENTAQPVLSSWINRIASEVVFSLTIVSSWCECALFSPCFFQLLCRCERGNHAEGPCPPR